MLDRVDTLGELRRLVAGEENGNAVWPSASRAPETTVRLESAWSGREPLR